MICLKCQFVLNSGTELGMGFSLMWNVIMKKFSNESKKLGSKNWNKIFAKTNYWAEFPFTCMSHWPAHVYDFNLLCKLCTASYTLSRLLTVNLEIWFEFELFFVFSGGSLLTEQSIQWVEYMHQSWICQGISDSSSKIYSHLVSLSKTTIDRKNVTLKIAYIR